MALMHIRNDPLAHFMPTITNARGTFFCAAPPGMAPELANLFLFPAHSLNHKARRERAASPNGERRSPKRARITVEDDEEVEVGRRQGSAAPSAGVPSDVFGGDHFDGPGPDISFGLGDFQMDLDGPGDLNIDVESAVDDAKRRASKAKTPASELGGGEDMQMDNRIDDDRRSRYSTPAEGMFGVEEGMSYSDVVCPIATFDTRPAKDSQGQTQQSTAPADDETAEDIAGDKDGYSKQTVKAMGVLRKHFRANGASGSDATPRKASQLGATQSLSFNRLSEKVRSLPAYG